MQIFEVYQVAKAVKTLSAEMYNKKGRKIVVFFLTAPSVPPAKKLRDMLSLVRRGKSSLVPTLLRENGK
jgi:hypothetical protein